MNLKIIQIVIDSKRIMASLTESSIISQQIHNNKNKGSNIAMVYKKLLNYIF